MLKKKAKKGFTIVELVIVIAVIAILAAVLIPTFSNVVGKAKDAGALADAKNAYTQYTAAYAVGDSDDYVTTVVIKSGDYYFSVENGAFPEKGSDTKPSTNVTHAIYTTGNVVIYSDNEVAEAGALKTFKDSISGKVTSLSNSSTYVVLYHDNYYVIGLTKDTNDKYSATSAKLDTTIESKSLTAVTYTKDENSVTIPGVYTKNS